jgi:hypothetical protein
MRQFNPIVAQEIQKQAEYPPDSYCGAVLLRRTPHEFYYKAFGKQTRSILTLPVDRGLLICIVQFIEANSNFTRTSNRDLLPVFQQAWVPSPYSAISNFFISAIPHPETPVFDWMNTRYASVC